MADTAPETTPDASTTTPDTASDTTTPDTAAEETDWKAEAEKWKTQARKHEERAKANSTAAKELDQLRQQSMSETEKAVVQAKAEGRAEAAREAAAKVAAAEIRAVAAGRLSESQLATLIEGVNLAAFVDDDGDVDLGKVTKFVEGIAPPAQSTTTDAAPGWPDLAQGARGAGKSTDDPLLAHVKKLVGST